MSGVWKYLFGGADNGSSNNSAAPGTGPLGPASGSGTKPPEANEDDKFVGGFDPRALERAAKAAKELEANPFAKEAIGLSKEAEKSSQMRAQGHIEEMKANQAAFAVEQKRVAEEERRKTMDLEHRASQQNAQYQDQLNRKRYQDELQAHAAMRAQELKRQEESQLKMEQLRRETAAYEAQLRKETEAARAGELRRATASYFRG